MTRRNRRGDVHAHYASQPARIDDLARGYQPRHLADAVREADVAAKVEEIRALARRCAEAEGKPVSYHKSARLPDGREVCVDWRVEPASTTITRINTRIARSEEPDPADLARLAAWLDTHPGETCDTASILAGCHQERS